MNSVLCGFFVTFNLQDRLQDPPLSYHFKLGYLRCTSFPNPPQKNAQFPPPPPKKILLSLQYISNCTGKIIRRDEVSAHTATFLRQNCVSKCTKLHHRAYSFQKRSGWVCPRTPLGSSWPLATQEYFSPKR